jgi:hypothetical protein
MKQNLYHGSEKEGLKELKPFQSTQMGEYVYATPLEEVAIIFSSGPYGGSLVIGIGINPEANNDDSKVLFDLIERKEGAFQCYKQPVSIYEVDPTNFEYFDIDNWGNLELRASGSQKIIGEHRYKNIYDRLLELEKEAKIKLYHYPEKPPYIPKDNSDLIETAFQLYRMGNRNKKRLELFVELYPEFSNIVNRLYGKTHEMDDKQLDQFINSIFDRKAMCLNEDLLKNKER